MNHIFRDTLIPDHFTNFSGEDKFDFAAGDLFVEAHRVEQFPSPRSVQADLHRQAGALEKIFNPRRVAPRQAEKLARHFCRRDLADGNRLAVQKFAVAGNVFNGVADGVAEIQDRAQSAFGFILADDFRLDFAAARNDRGERFWFAFEQLRQVAFKSAQTDLAS